MQEGVPLSSRDDSLREAEEDSGHGSSALAQPISGTTCMRKWDHRSPTEDPTVPREEGYFEVQWKEARLGNKQCRILVLCQEPAETLNKQGTDVKSFVS